MFCFYFNQSSKKKKKEKEKELKQKEKGESLSSIFNEVGEAEEGVLVGEVLEVEVACRPRLQ